MMRTLWTKWLRPRTLPRRRRGQARPRLEPLEDRLAPAVVTPFTPRFTTNDTGDIALVGNTLMTATGPDAVAAQNGTGTQLNNNNFQMAQVNVDGDPTTINSSRATLDLPDGATVLWAGLYWGGRSSSNLRNQVRFDTPATPGYVTLTGTLTSGASRAATDYQGFADVTNLVRAGGDGSYQIANVQAQTGTDRYAGWSLVVVYRDPLAPARNLTVFDGYAVVQQTPASDRNVDIPVSGFIAPPSGTVNASVGFVTYEGDRGSTGDSVALNGTTLSDGLNPPNNFFNSSITNRGDQFTSKTPNFVNQLGFDADVVQADGIIPNGATSATISLTTGGETYYPGVVTFAVDLYAPILTVPKTVTDLNGGSVQPGDVLEYTVTVSNSSAATSDPAGNLVLTDDIPVGSTYLPGSLRIVSGANAGAKSDAAGDDQAQFDAANDRVVFRLGTGANATAGGTLGLGASTTIAFRVVVTAADNATVENQAALTYEAVTSGFDLTSSSTPVSSIVSPENTPPVHTVPGPQTTNEDTPLVFSAANGNLVRVDDRDAFNEPVTTTISVSFGTLTLASTAGLTFNAGGPSGFSFVSVTGTLADINAALATLTYTPNANFNGSDSLLIQTNDLGNTAAPGFPGTPLEDTDFVPITVVPVNDPPQVPDILQISDGVTPTQIFAGFSGFDPDGFLDPTSVTIVQQPAFGTAAIDPTSPFGLITYTPGAGYVDGDTFRYLIRDNEGAPAVATVRIFTPQLVKSVAATSEAATVGNDVTIGEIVRFRFVVLIPEGFNLPNFGLGDALPVGLTFLNDGTAKAAFVANGPGITSSTLSGPGLAVSGNEATVAGVTPTFVLPPGAVEVSLFGFEPPLINNLSVRLGNVFNGDSDTDQEFVVVEFNAIVDNIANSSLTVFNDAGDILSNEFSAGADGAFLGRSNTVDLTVVEPSITDLAKGATVPPGGLGSGDTVNYTLTFSNQGSAPAYNTLLIDQLPPGLDLNESAAITVASNLRPLVAGVDYNLATPPALNRLVFTTLAGFGLEVGEEITITYQATLLPGFTPGELFTNNARLTYTSLPGSRGTFPNPTGSQSGVAGSGTGERTGAGGVNSYLDAASATVTAGTPPAALKTIVATSVDQTTGGDLMIAEIVRYRLVVQVPAGANFTNFTFTDALPAGLRFITSDGTAKIGFVTSNPVPGDPATVITASAIANPTADLYLAGDQTTLAGLVPAFPLDASLVSITGNTATLSLGNVFNPDDGDGNAEFIVIEFNAQVLNVPDNQVGTLFANAFTVTAGGLAPVTSNTVNTTIVEPSITDLVKTADKSLVDAGDVINYALTFSNTGNAVAFDVRVQDRDNPVDPASVRVFRNGVEITSGFTVDPGFPPGLVVINEVAPGDEIRIEYQSTVDPFVAPGADLATPGPGLTRTALVTYTSLPLRLQNNENPTGSGTLGLDGEENGERTGDSIVGADPRNDYFDTAPGLIITAKTPSGLVKEVVASSNPETGLSQFDPALADLNVGELVTYRLTFTLHEGAYAFGSLTLTDSLPTGADGVMSLVDARLVSKGRNIDISQFGEPADPTFTFVDTDGDTLDDQVLVTFGGTVLNLADNIEDDGDRLTLEITARVEDEAVNAEGKVLTNDAVLAFGGVFGEPPGQLTSSADVEVVEPSLLGITKSVDRPTADAGDVVTYTVVVRHAPGSTGAAYDLLVRDLSGADVGQLVPGTVTTSDGTVTSGNTIGDTEVQVLVPALAVGESVTVTYRVRLAQTVEPHETLTNTASVAADSAPGDGGRAMPTASASASLAVPGYRIAKSIVATSNPATTGPFVVAGEEITFGLAITLPEGTAPGGSLTDVLPAGLQFVPGSVALDTSRFSGLVNAPAVSAAGQALTFTFDEVRTDGDNDPATNTFVVQFRARVLPAPPGTTLTNSNVPFRVGAGPTVNSTGVPTVIVGPVQADLALAKVVSNPRPMVGSLVTFTLVLRNRGPAAATGVVVRDPVPRGLTLVAASATRGGYNPATGIWRIGALPVGAAAVLQVVARVNAPGRVVNAAVASAAQVDPVLANNQAAAVLIAMLAPAQVSKRPFLTFA